MRGNIVSVSKYYPGLEDQKRKNKIVIDLSEKQEEKHDYIEGILEACNWRSDRCDKNESPRMLNQLNELAPEYETFLWKYEQLKDHITKPKSDYL